MSSPMTRNIRSCHSPMNKDSHRPVQPTPVSIQTLLGGGEAKEMTSVYKVVCCGHEYNMRSTTGGQGCSDSFQRTDGIYRTACRLQSAPSVLAFRDMEPRAWGRVDSGSNPLICWQRRPQMDSGMKKSSMPGQFRGH